VAASEAFQNKKLQNEARSKRECGLQDPTQTVRLLDPPFILIYGCKRSYLHCHYVSRSSYVYYIGHWFTQSNSGAGPAGLALASTLVQAPNSANRFRINVYEAASTFVEIGAGILISGRSFAIARALGFEDKFKEIDQQKDKSDAGLCNSISDLYANSLSFLPEFTIFVRRSDLGDQSHEFYRISPGELLFTPFTVRN